MAWSDCNAASMPESYGSRYTNTDGSQRHHAKLSEASIREAMPNHPTWMVDNVVSWAQTQQERGNEFANAQAVVNHYPGS